MAATRRSLATAASLFALFGSTGPFADGPDAAENGSGQAATLKDYAEQQYEAWPEDAGGELACFSKFLPRCAADFQVISLALAVMKRDHEGNAAVAAQAPGADLCQFAEALHDMSGRYRELAEMLKSAQLRVMADLARHLVSIGEA